MEVEGFDRPVVLMGKEEIGEVGCWLVENEQVIGESQSDNSFLEVDELQLSVKSACLPGKGFHPLVAKEAHYTHWVKC